MLRELPSRIRVPRGPHPDPRSLTPEQYQTEFCIAHSEPTGAEGIVTLDVIVGKDGVVQSLTFHSGDASLAEAAIETVSHWTYRPLLLNGRPVEVATEIDVHFQS